MQELHKHFINNNRRNFLKKTGLCIGGLALGSIVNPFESSNEDPFLIINYRKWIFIIVFKWIYD